MNSALNVTIGQYTTKGVKAENQDFLAYRVPKDSLLALKGITLAMADGISSSAVSQIASETAVKSFIEDYYCTSDAWTVKTAVQRVLKATNAWLYSHTMASPHRYDKDKGYVCTFSSLVIKNKTAHICHVGDTRIYHCSPHGVEQLTKDHRIIDSAHKSYLSRALGMAQYCDFEQHAIAINVDELFIIATDGVYEFISMPEIMALITLGKNNQANLDYTAKAIVEKALANGSDDNLSIQIARIDSLPEQETIKIKQEISALELPPILEARHEFDGYTIIRNIHASSRSHLYLAKDNSSKNCVVLKTPSVNLADDNDYLEHFVMEEWVSRRLNSPYLLKAATSNKDRKYLYTVFEFIEGKTLAQWAIDNPKPDLERVRDIIEQIAKGLQAMHRMDMLHQDLRPENIMIDENGTVKIIDFGAVYVAGIQESLLIAPVTYLKGTALYSAPEYFLGLAGSTQSDLFSLGVITYFLLSGRYPYNNDVAKTKSLTAQKNLVYKTVLHEDLEIPAWIDSALKRALQAQPEKRYQELSEFIHDLRQPNANYLNEVKPPLIESHPVEFWQFVSVLLFCIIIYLLNLL